MINRKFLELPSHNCTVLVYEKSAASISLTINCRRARRSSDGGGEKGRAAFLTSTTVGLIQQQHGILILGKFTIAI